MSDSQSSVERLVVRLGNLRISFESYTPAVPDNEASSSGSQAVFGSLDREGLPSLAVPGLSSEEAFRSAASASELGAGQCRGGFCEDHCFLLRVRAEGLMILLPGTDNVRELLDALNTADPGAPLLYTPVAVTCETPRRRNVGEIDLFLVDLPWSWLAYFRSGAVLRGSPLELVSIKSGQATVHPIQEAAQAAADLWIATAHPELLESGLGEYVTVAEDLGGLLRDDAALGASWRNCSCPGPAASAPPAGPSIGGAAARSSGFAEELETCFLHRSPEFSKPL